MREDKVLPVEVWTILEDEEYRLVWDKIDSDFHFTPNISQKTFDFTFESDCYEIDYKKYYENSDFAPIIKAIFMKCIKEDSWMYVLDWQHTCFHWNPRIKDEHTYPVFYKDERFDGGGYNLYFPEFYPNGDYYFFLAKDFRWGYLGHPWKKKIWVYGNELRDLIQENADKLELTLSKNE